MFEQCRYLLVPQTCMHCACTYLYSCKHVHTTYGHKTPPSHPIIHFHCFPFAFLEHWHNTDKYSILRVVTELWVSPHVIIPSARACGFPVYLEVAATRCFRERERWRICSTQRHEGQEKKIIVTVTSLRNKAFKKKLLKKVSFNSTLHSHSCFIWQNTCW